MAQKTDVMQRAEDVGRCEMPEKWDLLIRNHSYQAWEELEVVCCDWRDVAQEVRMIFIQRRQQLQEGLHPNAFISAAARYEARRAARRLCGDELRYRMVHIDADPGMHQMFYSSKSSFTDTFID